MADKQDVTMQVFGEIVSFEQVEELAAAIVADEVKPNWDEGYLLDAYDAAEHVLDCAGNDDAVFLCRPDTASDLSAVAEACRDHGLAYRIFFEANGSLPAKVHAWAPGFDAVAVSSDTDDRGDALVSAAACEREFRKSSEAGFAFLARHGAANLPGVKRRATILPATLEEIRDRLDASADAAAAL